MLPSGGLYGVPNLLQQRFRLHDGRRVVQPLEIVITQQELQDVGHPLQVEGSVARPESDERLGKVARVDGGVSGAAGVQKSHAVVRHDFEERRKLLIVDT